jgi:hyaluronan synthase
VTPDRPGTGPMPVPAAQREQPSTGPLVAPPATPSACLSARIWPLILGLTVLTCGLWIAHRIKNLFWFVEGSGDPFAILFGFVCALFIWQAFLAWRQGREVVVTPAEQEELDALTLCVNVPCYNEDPDLLHQALAGIFGQTRLPDRVEVIDDGSSVDYAAIRAYWESHAPAGVSFSWRRTVNRGKRHAQMETLAAAPEDIFITVDSDTVLDPRAIEEGLKPFADPTVRSVGGLILGLNKRQGLLTRVEDLIFTSMQLTVRSAYSQLGSVVVNSGAFALYRAEVVRGHVDAYLNETILGRPVGFSDDSLLTLYAVSHGRAVQQASAIAFTHWPENVSHHVRQQVRWMRGSALRTLWRARYLPLGRPAFWLNVIGFAQFIAITGALVYLAFAPQVLEGNIIRVTVLMCALAYIALLRSLLVRRSDETLAQRLVTFALSPLAMLWLIVFARIMRLYGMATFARTGWGTRSQVEQGPGAPASGGATPG